MSGNSNNYSQQQKIFKTFRSDFVKLGLIKCWQVNGPAIVPLTLVSRAIAVLVSSPSILAIFARPPVFRYSSSFRPRGKGELEAWIDF